MAKYKDIMDRIELTDEMRERVLINVKEKAAAKEKAEEAKAEEKEARQKSGKARTAGACTEARHLQR